MSEYARFLADQANRRMAESGHPRAREIMWDVSQTGELYLRDRPEWTARHTADLERKVEQDRINWMRAQKGK